MPFCFAPNVFLQFLGSKPSLEFDWAQAKDAMDIAIERAGGKRQLVAKMLSFRGMSMGLVDRIMKILGNTEDLRYRTIELELAPVVSIIKLPLKAGGFFDWHVTLPQDLLPHCICKCQGFGNIVRRVLEQNPPSVNRPWRLVLYLDEVTPGNLLRPDNRRKMVAWYASFLELGNFLRLETAWLTIGIIRSTQAKLVAAGLSGVMRHLMRKTFLGPRSISNAGILVPLACPILLFAKFHRLIADEAACKAVWNVKGAAGIRPCMDCKNVVAIATEKNPSLCEFDTSGYIVDIACFDQKRFDPQGDGDLARSHDALQAMVARGCTKVEIDKMEKASGINFDPDSLLADAELRPLISQCSNVRDPMHVLLANGIMNWELYLFLAAWAQSSNFKYETMKLFLSADWSTPAKSLTPRMLTEVFSDSRETASHAAGTFKASASEILSVYPAVRYFAERVIAPTGKIAHELRSFLACCKLLDVMQNAKYSKASGALVDQFDRAASHFLRSHTEAYAKEHVKPKHHFLMHVGKQWREDEFVLDCFVHERKHQAIKACADHVKNTQVFERTVLAAAVNACVHELEHVIESGLDRRAIPCESLTAALGQPCRVANKMRFNFVYYAVRDLLLLGNDQKY